MLDVIMCENQDDFYKFLISICFELVGTYRELRLVS